MNELENLKDAWEDFAQSDPFFGILSDPDKRGGKWDKEEFFQTGVEEINTLMADIGKYDNKVLKGKMLDFGCGVGRLTLAFSKYFYNCIGIDISPTMIELANRFKTASNCEYILNEKDDLSIFDDNTFDFVFSVIVLQHIPINLTKKYIEEFIRITKPEGIIVFQMPSVYSPPDTSANKKKSIKKHIPKGIKRIYWRFKGIKEDKTEMHCFDKENLLLFLNDLNIEVIDYKEDGRAGPSFISYLYILRKNG